MINLNISLQVKQNQLKEISKDFIYSYNLSDNNYICDAITEHADQHTAIYYVDILEWARDNISEVNRGIEEFGTSGDVFKDIQASQYLCNSEDIYKDYNLIMLCLALQYLIDNGIEELNHEQYELIENEEFDHNLRFDEVADWLNENILKED